MAQIKKKDYVTASELGQYLYCKRCWWLELIGVKPKIVTFAMRQGAEKHALLAEEVIALDSRNTIGMRLVAAGLLLLILYIVLSLLHIL